MRIRLNDGAVLTVPDGSSDEEIRRAIKEYRSQPKETNVTDALFRGLFKGLGAAPRLGAGATGLVESVIPGRQESLESLEETFRGAAEDVEAWGPGGKSDTLAEKVVEGIARAPGELLTLAPFGAVAAPLRGVAGLGAAMARPALALGTHAAVMHGGEGLRSAASHGLRGAAEGAAFGVAGRVAGKLAPEGGEITRRLLHGTGAGGVVGGAAALEGQPLEDVTASAATMFAIGAALPAGKYGKTRKELIDELKTEVDAKLKSGEITPKQAEQIMETAPTEFVPGEPTEFVPPEEGRGAWIETDLEGAGRASRRIPQLTKAGQEFYDTPTLRKKYAEAQARQEFVPRTDSDVIRRAKTELTTDAEGNLIFSAENADAAMWMLEDSLVKHNAIGTSLRQKMRQAKLRDDPAYHEYMEQYEAHLATPSAQVMQARGLESSVANAMRIIATARRNQPEWVKAARVLEKKGIFDGDMKFKEDIRSLLELSEGNPELQVRIAKAFDTPGLWEYFQEYWINGLLSGFPTHVVNIQSNQVMLGADLAEKRAALWAETKFKHPETGERLPKWVAKGEWDADVRGLRAAVGPALKVAWRMLKDENYEVGTDYAQWAELQHYGVAKLAKRTKTIGGKTGQWVRGPGRALAALDMFSKIAMGERYAHSTAYRIAAEEVMAGKLKQEQIPARKAELLGLGDKPVDRRVLSSMKDNAARGTFTEPLTPGMAKFAQIRDIEVYGTKPGVVLVPFLGTPWNVIRQAIKRSPLNLINTAKRLRQYNSGEITPQQFWSEAAGTAIGTGLTAAFVGLAEAGFLTGGGPVNPADRANKMARGWKPYSFVIPTGGGEKAYISLQRIEPLGTILGMAGDISELGDADDKYGKMTAAIKDNLTNKTFLMGLENFAAFVHSPEQFGSMWTRQMAGSLVPTGVAKLAQATDPYARHVESMGTTAGMPDAMLYRMPGLSQMLPEKSTIFGEPAERWSFAPTTLDSTGGKIARAAGALLSPAVSGYETPDKAVEAEFDRLSKYEGMPPGMPRRKKPMVLRGISGEDVELTDEEYKTYDRFHQMAKRECAAIIASPNWHRVPDELKAQILSKAYRKYRNAATKEVNAKIRRRTSVGE
jgi:gas vesicle protein